jgi:hypothetical protein
MRDLFIIVLIVIVFLSQIGGIVYWIEFIDDYCDIEDITIKDLLMVIIAPIGLTFVLIALGASYVVVFFMDFASPILDKQIFKSKRK